MNKSDYLRVAVLNHVLRGIPFTPPTTLYLALATTTPTSAGGGSEVTAPSYVRQLMTFAVPVLNVSSVSAPIMFPTPLEAWGNPAVGVKVYDALTAGNMLYFGDLATPKDIDIGNDVFFPAGFFSIAET